MTTTFAATLAAAALLAGLASGGPADPPVAPVRVVATLPVYASITEAIGGAEVEVKYIADPNEDSHFVRPKPSFALDLKRADMFITTGLDLELWVPALLDKAKNGQVMEGSRGYVTAYTGIELLDVPVAADRSGGDVHIFGNPHLHTDPIRTLQVARNIATGLKRVAPDRSAHWDAGLADFEDHLIRRVFGDELVALLGAETLEGLARNGTLLDFLGAQEYEGRPLLDRLGGWLKEGEVLRGARLICYHKNWAYFEDRFGVVCADYVEAKPGIPATPRHVARLIQLMREEGIRVLIAASYYDRSKVETVADRGQATAVTMPMYPGARPGLEDYFDVVDYWIGSLAAAVGATNHP